MADLRRIVDELRFYLESNEAEMTESVREAEKEYADASKLANQRLRRCGEFLNRNLRAEAIQLSEAEPDLLEVVSTLDFPGREKLDEVVSLYSLPAIEPLLMDVAEALNEAYSLQEPVKKLLEKHRFLALSRAPLKQRLAVLWKLSQQDPTAGSWETDTSEMERARLREMEAEARDAVKRVDADQMNGLLDELKEGKWIEAISQSFKSGIAQSAREVTRRDARSRVDGLATKLQTALAESELGEARQLKEQWDHWQEVAELDGFDPVSMRAQPTLRWIADEDAKEAQREKSFRATAAFREALNDERTSRAELEHARAALLRTETEIPPPMEERFQARVRQIDRRTTIRRGLIAGGSLAAVATVALLCTMLVRRSLRNAEVSGFTETLSRTVADGKLAEAREFANKHADARDDAHWQEAIQKLTDAESAETQRVADFASAMAAAAKATDYKEAHALLDKALRLAGTEDEKTQAERLASQLDERHNKVVQAKQDEVQQRLDAIAEELKRGRTMHNVAAPAADINALASRIGDELNALTESTRGSEAEYGARITVLKAELKGLQDSVQADSKKVAALEAIRNGSLIEAADADSAKQVSDYIAALAAFTQAFPDDPRTPDFQEVRNEAALYAGICTWQNLAAQWKSLYPSDFADLRKRVGECGEFLKKNPHSPAASLVQQYSSFAEAVLRRESDGLISKLRELFGGPLMHNVQVVRDRDGNAYYLKHAVDLSGKAFANIHYLSGFVGEEKNKNVPTETLKNAVSEPAPQSALSAKALNELDGLAIANWETCVARLSRLVLDAPDLDRFLRYVLLRDVLEYGAAGSDLLNPELQPQLNTLHNGPNPTTPWMLPDSPAAEKVRPEAAQTVIHVIGLDQAWSQAERRRDRLSEAFFCRCLFIGRLSRDSEGQWTCTTRWTPNGTYDLMVAVPGANGEAARWEPIGAVKDGKVTISRQERATVLREGRLVLARPPAADTVAVTGARAPEVAK
jgi:hypothetical protein